MPRAGDAYLFGELPRSHDPLVRINDNPAESHLGIEDLLNMWRDWFFDIGIPLFEDITGLDLGFLETLFGAVSSPEEFITLILNPTGLLASIPAIVEAITGVVGGLPFLGTFFGDLLGLLGNPSGLGSGDLGGILDSLENIPILGPIIGQILSFITGGLVPIPVGSVSDVQPNLLPAPIFTAGAIAANPQWTVDAGTTRTADGSGAAKVLFDGTLKAMRSGETPTDRIAVAAGQKVSQSIFVKHQDYAGTGEPIQLHVVPFEGDIEQAPEVIDTYGPVIATLDWPGHELSGVYEVPVGVTAIQTRAYVAATATAGTGWFDDGEAKQVGLLQQSWVEGLPQALQDGINFVISLGETIFEAITGGLPFGNLLEDVFGALQNIPSGNVGGVGGPANIGGSVTTFLDNLVSGFVGIIGGGASFSDVFNVGQEVSGNAWLGAQGWDILGIRNNKSLNTGFHATSQSNITLDSLALGVATLPTFAVTQATAITAYQRISEATDFRLVSWQGYGVTDITHCFVNIYKMDTETGDNELVHDSENLLGLLSGGTSAVPVVYQIPEVDTIHVEPNEVYGIEIAIRGTGTHNIAGTQSGLQDQPVYPRRYSSVRNSGTSAAPSSFTPTYGTNVPFVEFGVDIAGVEIPHSPLIVQIDPLSGTTAIPAWCNYVDRVAVGAGGGGRQGGSWGFSGEGGGAGLWDSDTIVRGVHFDADDVIGHTLGVGGFGGLTPSAGWGSDTVSTINSHEITGVGGAGGFNLGTGGNNREGHGPGTFVWSGSGPAWTLLGGAQQNSYSADGNFPGGGGAGGDWVAAGAGGDGAKGGLWYRFRQI